MRSCKQFHLCKPSVTILLAQIFSPIPPPPSHKGRGRSSKYYLQGGFAPCTPWRRLNVLLTAAKFAEIPRLPMHFKKTSSHLMNLHPNKEAAKEWGCGGRNFGAPDGPLPREGVNFCNEIHCGSLRTKSLSHERDNASVQKNPQRVCPATVCTFSPLYLDTIYIFRYNSCVCKECRAERCQAENRGVPRRTGRK